MRRTYANTHSIEKQLANQELAKRRWGYAEAAMNIGSSIFAEPVAGLAGGLTASFGGGHQAATNAVNKTRDFFTYQPRGAEGQQNLQTIGSALQPIAEGFEYVSSGMGDYVYDKTGSEALATAAYSIPTAAAELISFKTASPLLKIGRQYEIGDIQSGGNKQRGTFGGVKAKNANLEMQAAAEELSNRGVSPEEIWSKTGWFKGQDGMWRFEIDDKPSKSRNVLKTIPDAKKQLDEWDEIEGTFGQSFTHPELLKNYPDMRKNVTVVQKPYSYSDGASYSPIGDEIRAPSDYTIGDSSAKVDRDRFLHESQHAIQEREGFAKGGSPNQMLPTTDTSLQSAQKYYQDLVDEYKKTGDPDLVEFIKTAKLELDYETKNKGLSSYDKYQRLYGEAEARLVQERMNMTEAERKAYPPMKHMEDMLAKDGIKMDELIVRNDSGKSMSIESQLAKEELDRRGVNFEQSPLKQFEGESGNPQHLTGKESISIDPNYLKDFKGYKGEVRKPNESGGFGNYSKEQWSEFVNDIKEKGVVDPIAVTRDPNGDFKVVEGNHRIQAAIQAGIKDIPVEVTYYGQSQKSGLLSDIPKKAAERKQFANQVSKMTNTELEKYGISEELKAKILKDL